MDINSSHYDLSSHSSLHDAWLEYVQINEKSTGARNEVRGTEIELCFLGPFHDKRLLLRYGAVANYRVWSEEAKAGHGDLDTHEFGVSSEGMPFHQLAFRGNSGIYIEFSEFAYREAPAAKNQLQ